MTDLEKRVRHTLHELADAVPPSTGAKAEFERRLAGGRGSRGQVLAVAAAAVVAVTAVVVPLAVQRDAEEPAATRTSDGLVWSRDYDWLRADAGPYVLGGFTSAGEKVDAVAWVVDGTVCVGAGHHVPVGSPTDLVPGALVGTSCTEVPAWPTGPAHRNVTTRAVLADATGPGPLPGLLLFVTAPKVVDLDVRRGDGSGAAVRALGRTAGMNLFLADFAGPSDGFGYDAKDADGNVVESALT